MRNRAVVISGAVVVVAFAAWFVAIPKVPVRAAADARVEEAETYVLPPPSIVALDPIAPPVDVAPVAIARDAAADVAIRPEPLPEIDAFAQVPPGSERWTPEERQGHRDGLFEKLARREAQLERDIAADAGSVEQKRVTLDYLRERRAEILAGTRTRPPRADAEP